MVTENVNIVVRERGARVVKRNLDAISGSAVNATRTLRLMQNALFVLGGAGIVQGILKQIDGLRTFENRMRLVTDTTKQLNKVQQELLDISRRTRTAFSATSVVFTRTAFNTKELGLSMQQTLGFTEALNKAVKISGANAREAEAAMVQLSQAIASDRFSGDELRSVLEQLPFAADVIAQGVHATRGELRQMGKDGEITADRIINAFLKAVNRIDGLFGKLNATIGESVTAIQTEFLRALLELDKASGFSDKLIIGLNAIADNMKEITVIAGILGATLLSRWLGPLIQGIGASIIAQAKLTAEIARGRVIVEGSAKANLLKAQSHAAVAKETVRQTQADEKLIQSRVTSLRIERAQAASARLLIKAKLDEVRAIAAVTGQTDVVNKLKASHEAATQRQVLAIRRLSLAEKELAAASAAASSAQARQIAVENSLGAALARTTFAARAAGVALWGLRGALSILGGPVGLLLLGASAWLYFKDTTELSTKAIVTSSDALNVLNADLRSFEERTYAANEALKKKAQLQLADLQFQRAAAVLEKAFDKGDIARQQAKVDRLQEQFDLNKKFGSFGGASTDGTQARVLAEQIGILNEMKKAFEANSPAIAMLDEQIQQLLESLELFASNRADITAKAFIKLRDSVFPVTAAYSEFLSFAKALAAQVEKDPTLYKEANELLERRAWLMRDQLDPMAAMNRELFLETGLVGASSRERDILNEMIDRGNELRTQGIRVTDAQLNQIVREAQLRREQIQLLDSLHGPMVDLQVQQNALNALHYQGLISTQQFTQEMRNLQMQFLELQIAMGEGTMADSFLLEIARMTEGVQNLGVTIGEIFSSAVGNFVDNFGNAISSAVTGAQSLGEALRGVGRAIVGELIGAFIKLGLKMALNAVLGQSIAAAATAASVAQAGVIAAAWTPAATMVSLATFGANSPAAIAGMSAATLAATALTTAQNFGNTIAGTAQGTITGNLGNIPEFATGGQFMVGGAGGVDSQLVRFMASPNERVTVETPAQRRANDNGRGITVNIIDRTAGTNFEVNQLSESEVEIIARREVVRGASKQVAQDLNNPNSEVSRAVTNNVQGGRRRL